MTIRSTKAMFLTSLVICNSAPVAAFIPQGRGTSFAAKALASSRPVRMAGSDNEEDDTVAALRAAAEKARQQAAKLREELGESSSTATTVAEPDNSLSKDEVKALVPSLLAADASADRSEGWQQLQESSSSVFGSATVIPFDMSLAMLEQRTGLTAESLGLSDGGTGNPNVDLDDFKYATLGVALGSAVLGVMALAFLPPNIGATVCYLVALVPIAFLAIGSTVPQVIANAIASLKGEGGGDEGENGTNGVNPTIQQRICRHEAAHLCCGYWCGLPIASYAVDEVGPRVEFALPNTNKYTSKQVAALAVAALAGAVGEAGSFGKATSGSCVEDLVQLENVFRQAKDFYGAEKQQQVTRWAAFTANQLLAQNSNKVDQIVKALEKQATIEECVAILES